MKKISLISAALCVLMVSGPVEARKKQPQLTPMEIQAIQSREFETGKDVLFASTMSVFQDLGYTIDSADLATGFITASSPVNNKTGFFEALAGSVSSAMTKATAFVEQMPNGRARIRLNFISSKATSSIYGQSAKNDKPILDPAPYQAAWDKIDEAIFVRNALSTPAPSAPVQPPVAPPAIEPEQKPAENSAP